MKIYPKLSAQECSEEMKKIISQSEGLEIQFFDENGITSEFDFVKEVRKKKLEYPNLKEIIVHPPLEDYDIELIMCKDEKLLEKQLKQLIDLSEELHIRMCIIYHTFWTHKQHISTNLAERLKNILKIIEGKNVFLLIENLFLILGEDKFCSALELCKYIDSPNLRMCLDTTHIHCSANIWKCNFYELLERYFDPEICNKYIKQIHFAAALNNDGYIDGKTHGRMHNNIDELREEVEWIKKYKMLDKIFVTEVSENDYYSRKDQIQEIEMLRKVSQEI